MSFMRELGPGGVPVVTVQQAAELQGDEEGALIIDVREPHEYSQLRAPGARLLPLGQLGGRVDDLPRDRQLLLMCRSGARSQNATQFLVANGFANVANVEGGMLAWHGAGLPTASGEAGPDEGDF